MSSIAPLSLSKSRSYSGPLQTPYRPIPSPVTDSPGNWQHPRIKEITHRQKASVFTTHNIKTIVYNIFAIIVIHLIRVVNAEHGPPQLQALPLLNIGFAFLPLFRSKDDLSDIPLTPAQRQLLGLSPNSAAPTPNPVYSTPPRYSRTPSATGSVGKLSPTSSPVSTKDSSASSSRFRGSLASSVASPLLHKSLGYSGGPRSLYGLQSPLNASTSSFNLSTGSSIFSEPPPTPSPIGGKRTSVGLNNKWLYDRSRRSSGNVWP
ncbi:hypothetical protein VPNG_05577 [Cytospora leucostoma]|uniref:Nuclear pore complex component n=1 Tax=Cytospora leucostoma TaxID=1230097 RepID=A0A423X714_9PEZI|nr:hypothetical protein VPNG_05577 [Cytospora leucostoma]